MKIEIENCIKIYEGRTSALDAQIHKLSIFYRKYIKIEGEKIYIYVDKNEFDTLKTAFTVTKKVLSNTNEYEHYRINFSSLNYVDHFESIDC